MQNGVKPVYKLTTSLGKEITATGNHPFRTLGGWKNLEDLRVGERIASPAQLPVAGRERWPSHQLITLGWTLAEGNTCHPCGVYLYSNNETVVADMVGAAAQFENTTPTVKRRPERTTPSTFTLEPANAVQRVGDVRARGYGWRRSALPGKVQQRRVFPKRSFV